MAKVTPRLIALEINGEDYSDEVSSATINSAESDSDFLSFTAARGAGGRDYVLALTIAQDHEVGSLWSLIWNQVGVEIDGVYAPYGNATASVTQPHYEFTVIISEPDGEFLGAEADRSTTAVATVDVEWQLTGRPTRVTA